MKLLGIAMESSSMRLEAKRGSYRHGENRDEKGEPQARHGAGSEPDTAQGAIEIFGSPARQR